MIQKQQSTLGFIQFPSNLCKVATREEFTAMPELPQSTPETVSLADLITQLQHTWPVVHKALDDFNLDRSPKNGGPNVLALFPFVKSSTLSQYS